MSEGAHKRAGRPRSEAARRRVLAAARALLEEGGVTAVTIEAVAQRAKVGKPTIYRTWPNAQAVAMAALADGALDAPAPEDGDAAEALSAHLTSVVETFASRIGRSAAQLVASSDGATEMAKAFRHHVMLRSRNEGRVLLERAMAQGRVRADIDVEAALDMLYGPVFFRVLMGHAPLTAQFARAVAAEALAGLAPRRPRAARPKRA